MNKNINMHSGEAKSTNTKDKQEHEPVSRSSGVARSSDVNKTISIVTEKRIVHPKVGFS